MKNGSEIDKTTYKIIRSPLLTFQTLYRYVVVPNLFHILVAEEGSVRPIASALKLLEFSFVFAFDVKRLC
jgi:hypothetical protein